MKLLFYIIIIFIILLIIKYILKLFSININVGMNQKITIINGEVVEDTTKKKKKHIND